MYRNITITCTPFDSRAVMVKLKEAAKGFVPGQNVGPSVDSKQYKTVLDYIEIGKREAEIVLEVKQVIKRLLY